jgi:hypothetical protein
MSAEKSDYYARNSFGGGVTMKPTDEKKLMNIKEYKMGPWQEFRAIRLPDLIKKPDTKPEHETVFVLPCKN